MAKLSGVEIIIIIAVGFAVFVILFIVAHRQIARFKVRDLLSRPVLKISQLGASPAFTAQIRRNIADMYEADVQPRMWDDSWIRYFPKNYIPNYIHRAKAIDFSQCLKIELQKYGPQFDWAPFEELGEYFDRLKNDFPIDRIPSSLVTEFIGLYRKARFSNEPFGQPEYEKMTRLTLDILRMLESIRKAKPADGASVQLATDIDSESVSFRDPREKASTRRFLRGYQLLDSDGSTSGSLLGSKPLAKLRRSSQKRPKSPKDIWEKDEQVPLQVFHDNPLINFESAPSTSRSTTAENLTKS